MHWLTFPDKRWKLGELDFFKLGCCPDKSNWTFRETSIIFWESFISRLLFSFILTLCNILYCSCLNHLRVVSFIWSTFGMGHETAGRTFICYQINGLYTENNQAAAKMIRCEFKNGLHRIWMITYCTNNDNNNDSWWRVPLN